MAAMISYSSNFKNFYLGRPTIFINGLSRIPYQNKAPNPGIRHKHFLGFAVGELFLVAN